MKALRGLPWVSAVTVVDPDDRRRSYVARRFSCAEDARSLERVLDHLDVVVVATPVDSRATLARRSLDAGKHVLVETPLTTSAEIATDLQEHASRHDIVLATGYGNSPIHVWSHIRDIVAEGVLGRLHYVDAVQESFGPYRPDRDVLWDLAPPHVGMVNYVLNACASEPVAWGRSFADPHRHDVVDVLFQYTDLDVPFRLRASWLSAVRVHRVTFVGSRRMLTFEVTEGQPKLTLHDKRVTVDQTVNEGAGATTFVHHRGAAQSIALPAEDPVTAANRSFLAAVRRVDALPPPLRSGIDVVKLLAAAQEAVERSEPRPVERTHPSAGIPA